MADYPGASSNKNKKRPGQYAGQPQWGAPPAGPQGYQPLAQGYQPPMQGYQPPMPGYQPPMQGYQPPPMPGYPPPGQSYPPPGQSYPTPPAQNYQPPPAQNYQPPPAQNYQPPTQNYQPPPMNGYQPPNLESYPPPAGFKPPPQGYQQPSSPYQQTPPSNNGYQPPQSLSQIGPVPTWQNPSQGYFNQHPMSTCSGRRKALLIGINYRGTRNELRGCENDVANLQNYLASRGWQAQNPQDMVVLTETNPNPMFHPTRRNILNGINWLAAGNNPGDSLVFQFSGHGGQQDDRDGDESDGIDETILPLDFQTAGVITDDEINALLVKPLAPGVRLHAIFDSCHSGSVMDLPFCYKPDGTLKTSSKMTRIGSLGQDAFQKGMRGDIGGVFSSLSSGLKSLTGPERTMEQKQFEKGNDQADVIMFSGCKDRQTSADAVMEGRATGAMTYALIKALRQYPSISYGQLLIVIRNILQQEFSQVPQLSTCRFLDMNQPFLM
ncbi:Ca(2+)-dependent cysteine protease [Kappamyces sp. JEL0829]|nr:Ca(2+)-dependent cysteine protease [Kappamyces sp. JEL0829]